MRNMYTNRSSSPSFIGISVTGNLISSEKIDQIANSRLHRNTSQSYFDQDGKNIREEISVAFRLGQVLWEYYSGIKQPNFSESIDFAKKMLQKLFGYDQIDVPNTPKTIGSHTYNIAMEANNKCVPVVVAPMSEKDKDSFEVAYPEFGDSEGSRTKRRPDILLQEYLNASDDALWGIAFAGESIRLMRKNASFTRPTFIEFNLKIIFENQAYSDFTTMWLMLHSSRLNKTKDTMSDCWLEKWRIESIKAGTVIRDRLRGNFEKALVALGNGFLRSNPKIEKRLDNNSLRLEEYLEQLIRLVYRLIFVAVAEERNFIHIPSTKSSVRRLYSENYGFEQLRQQALKRSMRNDCLDVWEGVRILLRAFENGEEKLGIPPFGGLFNQETTPDLNEAIISNDFMMEGIYHLSYVLERNTRSRINWRDMATEELGSVYEGLLELIPSRMADGRGFSFLDPKMAYGSKRRSAGAYYTPDVLVQALLDSCLEPVLDTAERNGGIKELLDLKIIDPACGSGHFLLGAARRIADRVTKLRDADTLDYQQALRDVIKKCIYGVDNDSLTVELAKVALWIEAIEPGKPLGYLDANIKCGNSTVGILKLQTLVKGIPDEAFDTDVRENKSLLKHYKKKNQSERSGQGTFNFEEGKGWVPNPPSFAKKLSNIRNLPENTKKQSNFRGNEFRKLEDSFEYKKWKSSADLYIAAYFLSKDQNISDTIPTTGDVWRILSEDTPKTSLIQFVDSHIKGLNAFHWFLEFYDIFSEGGGFDVVIGNPPWEKLTILQREFFNFDLEIAQEANSKKRNNLISKLFQQDKEIEARWNQEKNIFKAKGDFIRSSGQFPLTSVGELNLYSLFTELSLNLVNSDSWIGLILKSTIFTGSTNCKLTKYLVESGKIRSVYDFRNNNFFKDVAPVEKFTLATIGPSNTATDVIIGIGLTNAVSLSDNNQVIRIDRGLPNKLNPDTGTFPQCETIDDLEILNKIAMSYRTLGKSDWSVRYSRGLDMTTKAAELHDKESIEEQQFVREGNYYYKQEFQFVPLFEGKCIHQYDHRYGTFDTIAKEKRYGIRASPRSPDISEYQQRDFEVLPRYWVDWNYHSLDVKTRRLNSLWNLAFKDVTNVLTNSRTAIGCIVGKVTCSSSLPNIAFSGGDAKEAALFLSMFNSVPYDYLLRQKFYGVHLNKSILMQSFVVARDRLIPYEKDILNRVGRLTGTSNSVQVFIEQLGVKGATGYSIESRLNDRAWLDALYFKIYDFNLEQVDYIFSTFPIWERKSIALWGKFLERDLTLEYFKNLYQ